MPVLRALLAISFCTTQWAAAVAEAQGFPNRPIRIVTPGTGGGIDFDARLIAQGLTASLGQQVIVDNRPSGLIPQQIAAKASADGYTLLISGSILWVGPYLRGGLPFDPDRDFAPITLAVTSPTVLVVNAALPVKNVRELIALAKSRPGQMNFASAGIGGSSHLAGELFKSMAGVEMVHVPYKGAGPALTDVISGQVQLMFGTAGAVTPHIKTGRLRALAVTSLQPSALMPALPTVAASGVPGYQYASVIGLFAPYGTPGPIVRKLNEEIVRVLNKPDIKEKFFTAGVEIVGSTASQFTAAIKSEMARLGKVIKDAGIRDE